MKKFTKATVVITAIAAAAGGISHVAKKVQETGGTKEYIDVLTKKLDEFAKTNFASAKANLEKVLEAVNGQIPVFEKKVRMDYKNAANFEGWNKDDIEKFANMTMESVGPHYLDPFWDDSAKCLICACVGLLVDYCGNKMEDEIGPLTPEWKECVLGSAKRLHPDKTSLAVLIGMADSGLDDIFKRIENRFWAAQYIVGLPYCAKMWKNFKLVPEKTRVMVIRDLAESLDVPVCTRTDDVSETSQIPDDSVLNAHVGNGTPKESKDAKESEVIFDNSAEETKEEAKNPKEAGEESEISVPSAFKANDVTSEAEDMTGEDMLREIRNINKNNPDTDETSFDSNNERWV